MPFVNDVLIKCCKKKKKKKGENMIVSIQCKGLAPLITGPECKIK